jgi:hypothetical protein
MTQLDYETNIKHCACYTKTTMWLSSGHKGSLAYGQSMSIMVDKKMVIQCNELHIRGTAQSRSKQKTPEKTDVSKHQKTRGG